GLAHRLWRERSVDLLVWVSATSRIGIVTRYAQAATDVTGVRDGDPQQGADRLLAWLLSTDQRWLIGLGDVTDPPPLAATDRRRPVHTGRGDPVHSRQGRRRPERVGPGRRAGRRPRIFAVGSGPGDRLSAGPWPGLRRLPAAAGRAPPPGVPPRARA